MIFFPLRGKMANMKFVTGPFVNFFFILHARSLVRGNSPGLSLQLYDEGGPHTFPHNAVQKKILKIFKCRRGKTATARTMISPLLAFKMAKCNIKPNFPLGSNKNATRKTASKSRCHKNVQTFFCSANCAFVENFPDFFLMKKKPCSRKIFVPL